MSSPATSGAERCCLLRCIVKNAAPPPGYDALTPPAASLRGFSFAAIGWITGVACFHVKFRETMTDRRPLLRAIFDAAVAAAHPDIVLPAHLRPVPKGRVICLAAGKAAAAMAA